jgi:hypothetical protein
MNSTRKLLTASLAVLLFTGMCLASQAETGPAISSSNDDSAQGLVNAVRESTAKFKDVRAASPDYVLTFGCVTGPDAGAMGLHYVNFDILKKGILDPAHPTILLYEPQPDGAQKLVGADFLILASQWDAAHPQGGAPQLMGQIFQYFEAPNRFGLPAFYTLHVWAWKENPNGAFVNWHPHISCKSFNAPSNF